MTPERNDPTHDEEPENGVLADGANLDTTGIGVLGAATARVDVVLPSTDDDDDDDEAVDDGVVIDESFVPIGFAPATDPATGNVDIVAAEDVTVDDETGELHRSAFQELADDEEFADEVVAPSTAVSAAEVDAAASAAATGAVDAPTSGPVTGSASAVDAVTPSGVVATSASASTAAARRARAMDEAHPRTAERMRARSAELAPRRLGEIEPGRESAELLTADRLLDPHHVVRPEPEGTWQHLLYSLSRHRINLGDGRRARERKELDRRIAATLTGNAKFVPVLSRKGGVGKTTITTLLGMALADARDDRIIAVDANPDRGTLADRIGHPSGKTVRDLVRRRGEISGYHDLSDIVVRDETRLDVLASDTDPHVSEAFNDEDYNDVAQFAAHYYSVVLTDTGTGIVHSVMGATLELADAIIVVTGLSVDEARLASETLTWLEANGHADKARNAVVVLNASRPGAPLVRPAELEAHFRSRVRSVVHVPYDPHIAAGSAISFRELHPTTRTAARELAATVIEGLRDLAPAV
ncbi:MinD/ParA family protein [Microbacterium sp. zg-Y818]|uniref:MinD/ParA family ATP-binding protein n=1 Tax=unclassified Microbacterium TaxID=2609290 RepID=UPI00214AF10B|nr:MULTISPECIES: MinD/ParA family protein [unclassified Microbacterium]MCR2800616.1 MinD/ParA family protein [Microbacterium sp. zg.Y818]WIM23342.1 MinD/ParA family protein [Microbacterium sp. zg-Y818]